MALSTPVKGVFHAKTGRYQLNYYDAKRLCALHGATLATYNELHKAWQAGLGMCGYVNAYFILRFMIVTACTF